DDFVDVDVAALGLVLPREVKEIFYDAPRALRFVVDLLGLRELAGFQFVRDAGDKLAERGHFFRLQHLRLNLPLTRDVRIKLEPSRGAPFAIEYRPRKPFDHAPRRSQDFEFVVERLALPLRERAP